MGVTIPCTPGEVEVDAGRFAAVAPGRPRERRRAGAFRRLSAGHACFDWRGKAIAAGRAHALLFDDDDDDDDDDSRAASRETCAGCRWAVQLRLRMDHWPGAQAVLHALLPRPAVHRPN